MKDVAWSRSTLLISRSVLRSCNAAAGPHGNVGLIGGGTGIFSRGEVLRSFAVLS
jgi:hypothetical protein